MQFQPYFGTDEEESDVKNFIREHGETNMMELVVSLVETLAKKSDREWSSGLAAEYIKLFTLYR